MSNQDTQKCLKDRVLLCTMGRKRRSGCCVGTPGRAHLFLHRKEKRAKNNNIDLKVMGEHHLRRCLVLIIQPILR